jgi:plasmid stability protein
MATIQVRDIPEETARVLKVRAAKAGQSLQEYLRAHLVAFAAQPTVNEWVDEMPFEGGVEVPLDLITSIIRADRDGR